MSNNLEALLEVEKTLKEYIKSLKDVEKKSNALFEMTFENSSTKRRAAASDRLTDACHHRNVLEDHLHAKLVDADLCPAKPLDHYVTREITHAAGFGHSIDMKYTPARPKSIQSTLAKATT